MSSSIGQTLVGDQQTLDLLKASPGTGYRMSKGAQQIRPALFGEHPPPTQVNTLTPFSVMGMAIAQTISTAAPVAPSEHIGVIFGLREQAIDAFLRPPKWEVSIEAKAATPIGLHIGSGTFSVTITPAAAKYARSRGFYGSLVQTTEMVHKIMPTSRALNVDAKTDPEEREYTTICFTITTAESVERVLELDDALKDALYESIPSDDRLYLSFIYGFE